MELKEKIFDDMQSALWQSLTNEQMELVRDAFYVATDGYDVTETERHLVKYDGGDMELFQRFFVAKSVKGLSPNSLRFYKNTLDKFFAVVGKHIGDVTTDDVRIYLAKMRAAKSSAKHMNNTRRILSSFFGWLQAEEAITSNPMSRIGMIREPNIREKALTETQMESLRQACTKLRDEALVEFLYSTGCRVGEVVKLNRVDVDFATSSVVVVGKGSKSRTVFLSPRAIYLLKAYLAGRTDNYTALFAWDFTNFKDAGAEERCIRNVIKNGEPGRLSKSGVEDMLRQYSRKIGIRIHPHLLRKTVATHALHNGMPIDQVQKMLGHAEISTTLIYAQTDSQDVAISHQKYVH